MNELSQFQQQAAQMALQKMFANRHFSICDMDELAKLIGVQVGGQDYQALRVLHCINWCDMPETMRTNVQQKIVELLGLRMVVDVQATERTQEPRKEAQQEPKPLRLAFWRAR